VGIKANRGLAEILINNLLLNAVRHNVSRGRIVIKLEENSFTISNTGNPHPIDEKRLFKRFGKDTADLRSNGLGLAIIKEICDRYGWQVKFIPHGNIINF
jgi:Signal transduction histidine kinase